MKKNLVLLLAIIIAVGSLAFTVGQLVSARISNPPPTEEGYGRQMFAATGYTSANISAVAAHAVVIEHTVPGVVKDLCYQVGATTGAGNVQMALYGPVTLPVAGVATTTIDGATLVVTSAVTAQAGANPLGFHCLVVPATPVPAGEYVVTLEASAAGNTMNYGVISASNPILDNGWNRTFTNTFGTFPTTIPATSNVNGSSWTQLYARFY